MATEFKLSGVTSLNLADGEKREVQVEGVEGGKVLLSRVQGAHYCTSAYCSHYGAPLQKGVLSNHRLTCPWHGACFDLRSGDIEDGPALDPLARFDLVEKNGAVFIKADASTIQANRRQLHFECTARQAEKVLVVGGGSGSIGVVEGLRGSGWSGAITIISKEGHRPIDRTKLSKALLADLSKAAWRSPQFYKDAAIDLVNDEVTSVDFARKSATTASGMRYDYTKLVLASGGTPRWLPLEGLKGDLSNVFVLRTLGDVEAILKAAGENGKKVVVIGSSFIGMEIANCLASKKNEVSVVGMESEPMERVMGSKVGRIFRKLLEKNGVKFYMDATVDRASPSTSDASSTVGASTVGAVHLRDGSVLHADFVVEGVGVAPATEYLSSSVVQLEKDGSVRVDDAFSVAGVQDVFAVGDIATYPYMDGNLVRIEHWNVAQNAGRTVAKMIAHPGSKPEPFVPVFWSALGSQLRYCGNTVGGYDDVVIHGDVEKPAFVAYYTRGETVVAAASMGKDPAVMRVRELMRLQQLPSKSELLGGLDMQQAGVPSQAVL